MKNVEIEQRYVLENSFTGRVVCHQKTNRVYYFLSKFHALHYMNEHNINKEHYNMEGRTVYVKKEA